MKITSCDCFEKMFKKFTPYDEEWGEGDKLKVVTNNGGKVSVMIDGYSMGQWQDSFTLVFKATYCPYCGKRIEVKNENS